MRYVYLLLALLLSAPALHTQTFQGLGDLPGGSFSSKAHAVSADGTTVVGESASAGSEGVEAFRWTADGGMVGLGDLSGGEIESTAYSVSVDGSVVVGEGDAEDENEAFRWAGTMEGLGVLPGDDVSAAFGVSDDGSVVVGYSANGGLEAFRWTAASGMEGLGDLPGGSFSSHAYSVSADGSIVVGRGEGADGREAFRWTAASGMEGLGDLPGGSFFRA